MQINVFTAKEAKQKWCWRHSSPAMKCNHTDCMAWQWADYEKISTYTTLKPDFADFKWQGYTEDQKDPELTEGMFEKPKGDGWSFKNFYPDPEDGWVAAFEREHDPERPGYCAALSHPLRIDEKLSDLEEKVP